MARYRRGFVEISEKDQAPIEFFHEEFRDFSGISVGSPIEVEDVLKNISLAVAVLTKIEKRVEKYRARSRKGGK